MLIGKRKWIDEQNTQIQIFEMYCHIVRDWKYPSNIKNFVLILKEHHPIQIFLVYKKGIHILYFRSSCYCQLLSQPKAETKMIVTFSGEASMTWEVWWVVKKDIVWSANGGNSILSLLDVSLKLLLLLVQFLYSNLALIEVSP